jgi:acetoin utilization protein AcuB
MHVGTIMTRDVVTVDMDESLRVIGEIFAEMRFHHLLVLEEGQLRGVISDRDLLKASSPFLHTLTEQSRDVAIMNKRAHQIMSRKPITVSADTSLPDAVRLLLQENVSCLPVLSSDGQVEGIVTWRDLIRAHIEQNDTCLRPL